MFDNLSFIINNYSKNEFDTFIQKNNLTVRERSSRFQVDWYNLRVNYFPNESILKISNSLHKFYNVVIENIGAVNHTAFKYSQVKQILNYLENALGRNVYEMKLVGRFEFGFNVNTNIKPMNLIGRFKSLVQNASNPFYPMCGVNGKTIGMICAFTKYRVKAYDKGLQSEVYGKKMLRYEIVSCNNKMTRSIFGASEDGEIATLKDLGNLKIWKKCFEFLIDKFKKTRIHPFRCNDSRLYALILCYADPFIRHDYEHEIRTIYQKSKVAHDTYKYSVNSPFLNLLNSFSLEYDILISS